MLIVSISRLKNVYSMIVQGLLLTSCTLLEFSPSAFNGANSQTNLTAKNLALLAAHPLPVGDTLRFAFTGDSQRFYDHAENLVKSVNQQSGVALLLLAGDVSDFGLTREMRWIDNRLRKLNVPYLTVIGNHDQVGNGRAAYQHVFGPLNYSFVYSDTKFICIDTNSREYHFNGQVPDVPWLQQQVNNLDGAKRQVVIAHVPPDDPDFDSCLVVAYAHTLAVAPKLLFELNGHRHSFRIGETFKDGVTYINSYSFEKNQYIILTVWNDAHDQPNYRLKKIAF
ncbi:metallophosphoesterase (plasmid) [Hymenobacter sp. NBH84]|uniref:metallophosphoesterase family protein n=1 Tax=Hymenobacter sp. NBH84 TaxID=2596915 RepID=UPI001623658C|nr:metallophosphoesterase [Hymenobacter sp. NBH84]QNE42209.1 metallophosphoesterase [Hymenobacter sp. NBH84]